MNTIINPAIDTYKDSAFEVDAFELISHEDALDRIDWDVELDIDGEIVSSYVVDECMSTFDSNDFEYQQDNYLVY